MKILLPVDGSESAMRAVRYIAAHPNSVSEVHLLHVRHHLPGDVQRFVNHEELKRFHQEEAAKALEPAKAALGAMLTKDHIVLGDPAESIAKLADELGVDQIVMGTHGRSGLSGLLMGSVAAKTLHYAKVPVLVVK